MLLKKNRRWAWSHVALAVLGCAPFVTPQVPHSEEGPTASSASMAAPADPCEAYQAGPGADFVPPGLVHGPGDPVKQFTLREATAGLIGAGRLLATIDTTEGPLTCVLYHERTPYTVANFVGLARGLRPFKEPETGAWVYRPAYDKGIFHRIIKGFMAQGGDPSGTGSFNPGFMIPNEHWKGDSFDRAGLLGTANRGKDTNGMQFFVMDAPATHLNGKHTVFGECEADAFLNKLMSIRTSYGDRPVHPPLILSIDVRPEFECLEESNLGGAGGAR